MWKPSRRLQTKDIAKAPGNKSSEPTILERQRYWIAEAIQHAHPELIDEIFKDHTDEWPRFPTVERLSPEKSVHHGLGPILANEGTIDGTYDVINEIFLKQFGLDSSATSTEFNQKIQLVYGDQKTISLIHSVQEESSESQLPYDKYNWILSFPGLFHLRMNLMDLIHDTYGGDKGQSLCMSTLAHNANVLGCKRGYNTPHHFKEELAQRAFQARILALFYDALSRQGIRTDTHRFTTFMRQVGHTYVIKQINQIQEMFKLSAQCDPEIRKSKASGPDNLPDKHIDYEWSAHAKFLQQMEVYLTLKRAIKVADIGILRHVITRCCILFTGSNKKNYSRLSLYMAWLTQTNAATHELQTAILANGLVNLRGCPDTWFEIDRLNEFFNLQMKNIMVSRRSSTLDPTALFQNTALTASYYHNLRIALERAFNQYIHGRHTDKDVRHDIQGLARILVKSKSIKRIPGRGTDGFTPSDIVYIGTEKLSEAVSQFNQLTDDRWDITANDEGEIPDQEGLLSEPLYVLDQQTAYYEDDDE